MNYADPDGEQIELALSRLPASGDNKQGSLLFNFGGFGGGGIDNLVGRYEDDFIPEAVSAAYDLVSFDPRGVSRSTEVDCSAEGAGDENIYPASAEEIRALHVNYVQVATDCATKFGDYLQHLGTINVVRDVESIRVALAEEKINFVGSSAGTRIGALYLQQYPENSGRVVLDASVSSDSSLAAPFEESLLVMQAALVEGLGGCTAIDPNCDLTDLQNALSERAATLALDSSDDAAVELSLLLFIMGITQEVPSIWPFVIETITDYAAAPNVSKLTTFIGMFLPVDELLAEFNEPDAGIIAERAIFCADDGDRPDVETLVSKYNELNQVSNFFAETTMALIASCAGWPQALEPLEPIVSSRVCR